MGFLSSIGNAASSVASAVGDAVESTVDAVVDTVEDTVDVVIDTAEDLIESGTDWLCTHAGDIGCGIGNVIGGILGGTLNGIQEILSDSFDIIRDVGGLFGSLFRLDFGAFIRGLGTLALDVLGLGVNVLRFLTLGTVVGGIVDKFKRSMLRNFVSKLISDKFGSNENVHRQIRRNIGLEGDREFGFQLNAIHKVFVLDSDSVPLWRHHNDGTLDLYALAHLLSFDSFNIGASNPTTVVKSVDEKGKDSLWPINRWTISKYLESEGQDVRLRVYASSRQAVAEKLNVATRKLKEIGVLLKWNDGSNYAWFRGGITSQAITIDEYDFIASRLGRLLERSEFDRNLRENCELLALGAFKLERMGWTSGRDIRPCGSSMEDCSSQGRTDGCCNLVDPDERSGVIYRDSWPEDFFAYVLPHEIGHYLGLCHCNHDGFHNVMYTNAKSQDLSFFDWGNFSLYYESEPFFTLEDGKNAWRFIVDQLPECIGGRAPDNDPVIIE